VKLGPFLDNGQDFGFHRKRWVRHKWLFDTGPQAKLNVLGVGVVLLYGKDLRTGNNAFLRECGVVSGCLKASFDYADAVRAIVTVFVVASLFIYSGLSPLSLASLNEQIEINPGLDKARCVVLSDMYA